MKTYPTVDLTGDKRINPDTLDFGDGEGSHGRNVDIISSISIHHDAQERPHDYDSVARYVAQAAEDGPRLGPGLPYHYRIDNQGTIFACRPLTTWLNCVGSSENVTTIAICLDGNFQPGVAGVPVQLPTLEQCEALLQLLTYLCTERPDFPATWPNVRPHRDFSQTACPGDNEAPYVYQIEDAASAARFPANSGYDWPELQPQPPHQDAAVAPSTTTTTTTTQAAPEPPAPPAVPEPTTTTTTTLAPPTQSVDGVKPPVNPPTPPAPPAMSQTNDEESSTMLSRMSKAIAGGLSGVAIGLVSNGPIHSAAHALWVAVLSYVVGHAVVWLSPANK